MQYDSAIKCISPELSADIATLVLGRKPDLKQISESLPSDERLVDFLAKITGDEESILHIEFQTKYDSNMPVRMLAYHARSWSGMGCRCTLSSSISHKQTAQSRPHTVRTLEASTYSHSTTM